MAWQKLYGEMWDECTDTVKHTSSLRGINSRISGRVSTSGQGKAWTWDSDWTDESQNIYKIDLRQVKKEDRKQVRKLYNLLTTDKYRHDIHINFDENEEFRINGVKITEKKLSLLREMED